MLLYWKAPLKQYYNILHLESWSMFLFAYIKLKNRKQHGNSLYCGGKRLWLCLPGRVFLAIWRRLPQEPVTPPPSVNELLSRVFSVYERRGSVCLVAALRGGPPICPSGTGSCSGIKTRMCRKGRADPSTGSWPVVRGMSDGGGYLMHSRKLIGWQAFFYGGRVFRRLAVHCIASNQTVIILDLRHGPTQSVLVVWKRGRSPRSSEILISFFLSFPE